MNRLRFSSGPVPVLPRGICQTGTGPGRTYDHTRRSLRALRRVVQAVTHELSHQH